MPARSGGWLLWAVPGAVLVACLLLRVQDPPFLQDERQRVFDTYQRLQPRPYTDVPVRVVDIDDESMSRFGQWPWPRSLLADLVTRLTELGAATIVFDALFAEPDRMTPENILKQWRGAALNVQARAAIAALPDNDSLFADVIGRSSVVTAFVLTGNGSGRRPARKGGLALAGDDPRPFLPVFSGAVNNLPEIEKAARGNAAMNMVPERDGVVRRVPLLIRLDDMIYPTLGPEALRVAQGTSTFIVKASGASREEAFGAQTGVVELRIGQFAVPTDATGRIWIYETRRTERRTVPVWKVLGGGAGLDGINGSIVFVGTSAAALADLKTTPIHSALPGVEIQAQVVEQMLTGTFLQRPDWATGAEIVALVVLGVMLIGLLAWVGPTWGGAIGAVLLVGAGGASWYAFSAFGFLLDPFYPVIAVALVYLSSSVSSYLLVERQRRRLRNAFSHYVSDDLVRKLVAASDDELGLGGETREVSVLISDIRSFTGISERLDAETLTRFVNGFLTPMADVVMDGGGTIDKFMGDSVMAFWNAPLVDPHHARRACMAALAMHGELPQVSARLAHLGAENGGAPIDIRIGVGIATGECCVGNFGSEKRFDYSVIGDTVNLASRLEGLTKLYGVGTIVSETTRDQAPDLAMLELDVVRVMGKNRPARIFGVLGDSGTAEAPAFRNLRAAHDEMLRLYRKTDWQGARECLERCRTLAPDLDRLYTMYEARLDELSLSAAAPGWDGVYEARSK